MSLTFPTPRKLEQWDAPALRWGIIGTGFATVFLDSVQAHTSQRVVAVAGRDAERTGAFARKHGIDSVRADTSALIGDPNVDVVYIATRHGLHRPLALEAIASGKHVLIEKPFASTAEEAAEITRAATDAGVLAMEAMWTRYLPQFDILRQLLSDGVLGTPQLVVADFGARMPYHPEHRVWDHRQGGGTLLETGIYPIGLASAVLGSPTRIDAVGTVAPTGVEASASLLLRSAEGAAAQISASLSMLSPARASITGGEGRVEFGPLFFAPTSLELTVGPYGAQESATWSHPDPTGSDGYAYEASAFASYAAEGRVESPVHGHAETISILATIGVAQARILEDGLPDPLSISRAGETD